MNKDSLPVEISERWRRLREEMAKRNIDAILAVPGSNLRYLSGLDVNTRERLLALIIQEDRASLIFPAFEESRLARTTVYDLCNRVTGWEEAEDPYALAAAELAGNKRVALDPLLPFWQFERLSRKHKAQWSSAEEVFATLRMRKSPWELRQMRLACEITAEGIALELARLNLIQDEVDALSTRRDLINEFLKLGGADGAALIQFNEVSADPHGNSGVIPNRPSVVLIDAGANVEGYWADLTRTRCLDFDYAPEFREIYMIVWEAHQKAIESIRPGVTAASIDKAARDVIEKAGYGDYFPHRVGHGLGLDIHEAPYMVAGNELILEPGMAFTIEPGIYLPGRFGIRIEDNVAVTESGVEVLSPTAK